MAVVYSAVDPVNLHAQVQPVPVVREVHNGGEADREANRERGKEQRFAHLHDVRFPVEDAKIEGQHNPDDSEERNIRPEFHQISGLSLHEPPLAGRNDPLRPRGFVESNRDVRSVANEGHSKQERLIDQQLQPFFLPVARRSEPQFGKSSRRSINERFRSGASSETPDLADGWGADGKIHKMRPDASFGEKPERFANVSVFPDAKNLNFQMIRGLRVTRATSIVST
jgi:hypothetical protein